MWWRGPYCLVPGAWCLLVLGPWSLVLRASDGRFDQAIRFFGRYEHFVGIIQSERLQVDEQVMPVGHADREFRQIVARIERGRRHRVQRVLHRAARVSGKGLDEDRPDALA